MRKLFLLPAFVALVLITACSPKTTTAAGADAPKTSSARADAPKSRSAGAVATAKYAPTESDTSLLWTITGPGVTTESFLFGTIHLIPEADYFLPKGLVRSMNDADEIIFEIDPRQMDNPMAMMGLMTKINMRGDTSLADLLSEAEHAEVEGYFSKLGLPFFIFKKMKPLFLSAMVGQDIEAMQNGGMAAAGTKSYELEMTQIAKAGGKEITGLETIEFQLSIFDSIPYRAQAQMLLKAVRGDAEGDGTAANEFDKIVDMYKRKAIAEMATSLSDESAGVARFEELLLTKRNVNWIPKIEAKIKGEGAGAKLFAVGAGHLGGEKGVIALLRQEGYTVTPVY